MLTIISMVHLNIRASECSSAQRSATASDDLNTRQCNFVFFPMHGYPDYPYYKASSLCPSTPCRSQGSDPERLEQCMSGFEVFDCRKTSTLSLHPAGHDPRYYICNCDGPVDLSALSLGPESNMTIDGVPVFLDNYQSDPCSPPRIVHEGPCNISDSYRLCSWTEGNTSSCRPLLVDHSDPTRLYEETQHPLTCDGNEHTIPNVLSVPDVHQTFPKDRIYSCSCPDVSDSTELGSNVTSCTPMQYARDSLVDVDTAFLQVSRRERNMTPIIEDLPGLF